MLYVGIDVSKSKHDCFVTNENGEALTDVFTIQNSRVGFHELYQTIKSLQPRPSLANTKVGLEASGHYGDNIVAFLRKVGLSPIILNPLRVNLYRKGQTLRKTKTDKVDAQFIAKLLITENFESQYDASYHSKELKMLTRYRRRIVKIRSMYKTSYKRLLNIVFPEIEGFVSDTLGITILKLLLKLPNTKAIAHCHLTHLSKLAQTYSHGRYDKVWAQELKKLAKNSIGSNSPASMLELRHTIQRIISITEEIEMIEKEIKTLVIDSETPIITIPGISYTLAAIIIGEIGDIRRFDTSDKLQAFAGLDPSAYQSGQFTGNKNRMVKRGSTHLRWALIYAAHNVCLNDKNFGAYLNRKRAEGKHYNNAMGHVAKKLIRVIFQLMSTGEVYIAKA